MIYLREFVIGAHGKGYPFGVAALRGLSRRAFRSPVTLFVGENGSGKSTLMEALARKIRMPALGAWDTGRDPSLSAVDPLADAMKLTWNGRPRQCFFLRAEDFFGFVKRIQELRKEMLEGIRHVEEDFADKSEYIRGLAKSPYTGSLHEMTSRYGVDPDAQSHGERFLSIFQSRMLPEGLYVLDEPESALSPTRQMALLAMIAELSSTCQFLIATHSPILMATPGADIWNFDASPLDSVEYRDLPQVELMRTFLNAPERYIHHLIGKDEDSSI